MTFGTAYASYSARALVAPEDFRALTRESFRS